MGYELGTKLIFAKLEKKTLGKTRSSPPALSLPRRMPHFTAIALDRLLEPGASKSVDMPVPSNKYPVPKPKPKTSPPELKRPLPNSNLERRNSTSVIERKCNRPQISPGLYTTPASTPLPDSPTSFHPSPYIINHKRRGPRLLKSFSEEDLASRKKELEKVEVNGNVNNGENEVVDLKDVVNGVRDCPIEVGCVNASHGDEIESSSVQLGTSNTRKDLAMEKGVLKPIEQNVERNGDSDDFFDPQDSMSYTSNTDAEDTAAVESSMKLAACLPAGEFYDAWEELSSESGLQPSPSPHHNGAELREMRLSLLMEIEKRKQAEEESDKPSDVNPVEEICQQIYLARFVSESIGRGIAKAEAEIEMEAQVEAKNFEIARLLDRLHYYETVNQEMSQRNQEVIETARRNRQIRKRRRKWIWGSIAAAITLGTTALAWSYLPAMRGPSSASDSHAPEHDDTAT
ncbi:BACTERIOPHAGE N4 ADSORPTION B PROTEIN [Salix koriyanagi]|uniref:BACTERIOPHAGE N4 ADSORPTION B PROTEIN n=1 Tax=Salix koriyanagi TaxID=2511006 RepID=A0A9Q0ZFT0_9ROSI|nr:BACTERIOPHAGE N4 ADSORPTION B PROTEIN [Salix koriyanagi]